MGKSLKSAMKYERTPVRKDYARSTRELVKQSDLLNKGWFIWLLVGALIVGTYWIGIKSIYIIVGGL